MPGDGESELLVGRSGVFWKLSLSSFQRLEQLEALREISVKVEVNGKTEEQVLEEFRQCQQTLLTSDCESKWYHLAQGGLNYPEPCLLLVLPADLGTWDDLDPATHNFRPHFLCDIKENNPHGSLA